MVETREKSIDGSTYSVTQFPAFEGLRIKTRLIKLLGPSLGKLADSAKGGRFTKASLEEADISGAIEVLAEQLDEEEYASFVLRLLASTRKDGKEVNRGVFDMEFAGKLTTVYKVLAFVLEVNYGDFFGQGGIGSLLDKLPEPSQVKK